MLDNIWNVCATHILMFCFYYNSSSINRWELWGTQKPFLPEQMLWVIGIMFCNCWSLDTHRGQSSGRRASCRVPKAMFVNAYLVYNPGGLRGHWQGYCLEGWKPNMFSGASLCSWTSLFIQGSKLLLDAVKYKPTPDNLVTSLTTEVKMKVQNQRAMIAGARAATQQ